MKCDHGLRRQAIVESLLAEVFDGRLRAGQHLVTQELAERFGVSHTPIREALIAIAGIGVIDLLPNRGAVVRHVTARDVREICHVRRALECEAARSACGRVDLRELQSLAVELKRLTTVPGRAGGRYVEKARELDSRLHDLVCTASGNAFLVNELNRLKILFRAFRDVSYTHHQAQNDLFRLAEEAHEHLAIVTALQQGDRRAAVRAMSRHIRSGVKYWSRSLPTVSEQPHSVSSNGSQSDRPLPAMARKNTRPASRSPRPETPPTNGHAPPAKAAARGSFRKHKRA